MYDLVSKQVVFYEATQRGRKNETVVLEDKFERPRRLGR